MRRMAGAFAACFALQTEQTGSTTEATIPASP
jgi:hypothetical protein